MSDTLTVPFTEQDRDDLREWKAAVSTGEIDVEKEQPDGSLKRHKVRMPSIEASTEKTRQAVEDALEQGERLPQGTSVKLPSDLVESAKATFISTGGNISEVAALYDLTPEAVLRLATEEQWPVYGGGTKAVESTSKAQLTVLRNKLWRKIELMLDSMDVEEKQKQDMVQYRTYSKYVEPLSSRSSAFKNLMDQYMRVSTLLEPEVFANDPDGSNYHAGKGKYPGGIEGVNREMADFLGDVVMGIADKIKDRELDGYREVIDVSAQ